jgi:L-alanine-DL-glutamate epimerase-like enolase superfamily enzyme
MALRVSEFDLRRADVKLRMPFRYGIATMTEGPVVFLRLTVEVGGKRVSGVSSDLLPPKWFTKVPAKPIHDEIAEMVQVIRRAAETVVGMEGATPFGLWMELYEAQEQWAAHEEVPPLLSNFGVSLVERAILDGYCRAAGCSFGRLLRTSQLGIDLGRIHRELRGLPAAGLLPGNSLDRVTVRHTVGLSDPITEEEIQPDDRLEDGLPQSLEASTQAYGLRHFKIKVSGNAAADLERMERIAATLGRLGGGPGSYAFSLDGNEQFTTVEEFRSFWETLVARHSLKKFLAHLLFVEQPLARNVALHTNVGRAFREWPERPPIVIDESDARLGDCARALELGYSGTSHKNCKGIFKGVANRCLLAVRQRDQPERPWLMSGEDLCNIGPVALQQDLALMGALGITSVERNGHHYHAGLSQFPSCVQQQVLQAHGDLYHAAPAGWPTLRIKRGTVSLETVNRAPLGVGFELETRGFQTVH